MLVSLPEPEVGFNLMLLQGDNDGTITDALPDADTFPDLSVFTEARYFAVESSSTPAFKISGEVTSITVIPELGTLFLFSMGGLALLRNRKK